MKVVKTVFIKDYNGILSYLPIEHIPQKYLQEGSKYLIDIEKDEDREEPYSANTRLIIYEQREETEEEVNERKQFIEERKAQAKINRFNFYQKLKKEFENEAGTD